MGWSGEPRRPTTRQCHPGHRPQLDKGKHRTADQRRTNWLTALACPAGLYGKAAGSLTGRGYPPEVLSGVDVVARLGYAHPNVSQLAVKYIGPMPGAFHPAIHQVPGQLLVVVTFRQRSSLTKESARNLAGNPDSPQAVVFLTSIIDIIVDECNVLHILLCQIRPAYVWLT